VPVTYNSQEAKNEKKPTVYQSFTYDNETNGGILSKINEVNSIISDIETSIGDISSCYSKLQAYYDQFTDYNELMNSNKQKLVSSANNIKTYYVKLLKQMQGNIAELQSRDASLISDLTGINRLLGNATNASNTNNNRHSRPTNPNNTTTTTNTPYQSKYSGPEIDKIKDLLKNYGLTDEEIAKLADAIYEAAGKSTLGLGALALSPVEGLMNNYDSIMASLGDDGINIINKLLTKQVPGLEFNLSKDLLDNLMHDEGMKQLILDASSNNMDLSSSKEYLQAITNFADNNDITFDTMNEMIKGFDTFLTDQVNNTIGNMMGVTFDKENIEAIYNGLIDYYDYKKVDLDITNLNSIVERTQEHNVLSDAILDAIPDKEAAVKNILANQFGVTDIDLSDIDCEKVLHNTIRNAAKIGETLGELQNLDTSATGFGAVKQGVSNAYEVYQGLDEVLDYMGLSASDVGSVAYTNISNKAAEKIDEITENLFGWIG